MRSPKIQQIDEQLYNKGQSWHYEGIYLYGPHRLRVYIRRNAYDTQSSLKVEVWHKEQLEWKLLRTLPMDKTRASYEVKYFSPTDELPFRNDADELLEMAVQILG